MSRLVAFTLLFLMSLTAMAASGGVSGNIASVTVKETGFLFVRLSEPHANLQGCEKPEWVVFDSDHVARGEIMSVLLSAVALQKPVGFWLTGSGCYLAYGSSYPKAVTVTISK